MCDRCPTEAWVSEQDRSRADWVRVTCGRCGKFIGYRPKDMDAWRGKGKKPRGQQARFGTHDGE